MFGTAGSGNGAVAYAVGANPGSGSRTGSITIADKALTVTQVGGGGCLLDIDGNGTIDALTDGLLLLRSMFGLTGRN